MLKSIIQAADSFRRKLGITGGEVQAATLSRALVNRNNDVVIDADKLALGNAAHLASVQALLGIDALQDDVADEALITPFHVTGTMVKAIAATGSVVFTGLPTDGQTVTINDGVHSAKVFEFDDGTAATGTLTFTGVPADTGTVTLGDGTTSKVFEFDTGVLGVASTGGLITFTAVPLDGNTIVLTTHAGTATTYEFNTTGGVSGSNKAVLTGATTAQAAAEFAAAVNASGGYAGNGSTGYTATDNLDSTVTLVRAATGADNQTITKTSGTLQVETATAVGTITGNGNATVVVTASGVTGSPITTSVAVLSGDTASVWAGKVRTALALDANITAVYTVGGSGALISLTRIAAAANDATLNISLDNGTCTGITTAATSANSTAGVASSVTVTTSFSGGVTQVAVGSAITGGRVGVGTAATPGGSALTTAQVCTNLINAINAVSGPAFLFTASQGAGTTVTLTANTKGTAGNSFTMSESASNFTVGAATFANGAAAGSGAVTGSNTAVAIGASGNATATSLHTAINAAASLDITSTNSPAGTCALANDTKGVVGNVAISETASNVTATGMSGGVDTATVTLIAEASVADGYSIKLFGFSLHVNGGTAWNDAATVQLYNGADAFATIAKAALTGNAFVHPSSASVTLGVLWMSDGGDSNGLFLAPASNESTGSDLQVKAWGIISPV